MRGYIFYTRMGLMLDELRQNRIAFMSDEFGRNSIIINSITLKHHIDDSLASSYYLYHTIPRKALDLRAKFYEIDVTNFGRAKVDLALIYFANISDKDVRMAMQLVSRPLKRCSFERSVI